MQSPGPSSWVTAPGCWPPSRRARRTLDGWTWTSQGLQDSSPDSWSPVTGPCWRPRTRPPPSRHWAAIGYLTAVRDGPFGLHAINRLAEQALAAAGLIRPEGVRYAGRPVLVTANDYELRLYNGDLGLLLPDPDAGGELRAWFETADGLRRLSPHRLPTVETLFAMTVHKSQGSEFDEVALVLPSHDSRAVTRELIYTGVTRARQRVTLIAPAARLLDGVGRPVRRSSGLYDALWSQPTRAVDPEGLPRSSERQ